MGYYRFVWGLALLLSLSGCGKINRALDNAETIKDATTDLNKGVQKTNENVKVLNELMQRMEQIQTFGAAAAGSGTPDQKDSQRVRWTAVMILTAEFDLLKENSETYPEDHMYTNLGVPCPLIRHVCAVDDPKFVGSNTANIRNVTIVQTERDAGYDYTRVERDLFDIYRRGSWLALNTMSNYAKFPMKVRKERKHWALQAVWAALSVYGAAPGLEMAKFEDSDVPPLTDEQRKGLRPVKERTDEEKFIVPVEERRKVAGYCRSLHGAFALEDLLSRNELESVIEIKLGLQN